MTKHAAVNGRFVQTVMALSYQAFPQNNTQLDIIFLIHTSPVLQILQVDTISLFAQKDPSYSKKLVSMHAWTGVCLQSLCSAFLQVFAFDHCFWSMDESNVPKYAGESC